MDLDIRKINYDKLEDAFTLIWRTFLEFVAPSYSQEGIDTFLNGYIENREFKEQFKHGKYTMYGAYSEGRLVGVLAVSDRNYVSCVFVDKQYHRKGVASALFCKVKSELKKRGQNKILLNASPYALPFYHALGFMDTDIERDYKGIRYTTMELKI